MDKNILIIEDNKQIAFLYEMVLQERFCVSKVHSYAELEKTTFENKIDFIIVDYTIPGIDFTTLINYLKNRFSEAKILLITGVVDTEGIRKQFGSDLVDIWTKPITDIDQMSDKIEKYLVA